jgi:hypothetical protein
MIAPREIYSGLTHLGTITPGKRKPFRAVNADGRTLGEYETESAAMAAVTATRAPAAACMNVAHACPPSRTGARHHAS